jgi:hypothetical protein
MIELYNFDFEDYDPEEYKSLMTLYDEQKSNEEIDSLELYFTIDINIFGCFKEIPLIKDGEKIKVNN